LFRPRLGPTASKVAVVGIVYFIMSSIEGFMRASVVRHVTNVETDGSNYRKILNTIRTIFTKNRGPAAGVRIIHLN